MWGAATNPEQFTNSSLSALADPLGTWRASRTFADVSETLAYLHYLQGDSLGGAAIGAKQVTSEALSFIAAGRVGVEAKGAGAAGEVAGAGVAKGGSTNSPSSIAAIADNEAGGYSYYDQFKKADGSWDWPKDLGFAGDPVKNTLPVGTKLDRYGGPEGSFLSPEGVSFEQRALAPGSRSGAYYQYEVLKPLPVIQGEIAPAFGQPGGGVQILPSLSERYNVDRLVKEGYLRQTN